MALCPAPHGLVNVRGLRFDQGYTATSTSATWTSVFYGAKTWSTSTVKADKPRPPGQPGLRGTCLAAICLDLMQDPGALTSDIREALSHGQLTRDGTEDIPAGFTQVPRR